MNVASANEKIITTPYSRLLGRRSTSPRAAVSGVTRAPGATIPYQELLLPWGRIAPCSHLPPRVKPVFVKGVQGIGGVICIYCLRHLAPTDFTREHVIPEAFGGFEGNLTLLDLVCAQCNQHFGDTIDRVMARGSPVSVARIERGVQPPEKAAGVVRDRVRFAWDAEDETHRGMILTLAAEEGQLCVVPIPQVGFAKKSGRGLVYVSGDTLLDAEAPLPEEANPQGKVFLVTDSPATKAKLMEALRARKIPFHDEGAEVGLPIASGGMIPVEVRAAVDSLVVRCAAKIAFNYAAYILGREFILDDSFSTCRNFIRHETLPSYRIVEIDDHPILADDLRYRRQTNGHLITVAWAADGRSVTGQVSLFNEVRYRVSLARNYPGVWREIRSGHLFDIESRRVDELTPSSLARPGGVVPVTM